MAKKRKKKTAKRKKAKPARKRKVARRGRKEGPIARAYHTVSDTIRDTGKLRNKMEQRGSDETE